MVHDALHPDTQAFLEVFDAASQQVDADRLRPLFADPFLTLAPGQAIPTPREAFLASLHHREVPPGPWRHRL